MDLRFSRLPSRLWGSLRGIPLLGRQLLRATGHWNQCHIASAYAGLVNWFWGRSVGRSNPGNLFEVFTDRIESARCADPGGINVCFDGDDDFGFDDEDEDGPLPVHPPKSRPN